MKSDIKYKAIETLIIIALATMNLVYIAISTFYFLAVAIPYRYGLDFTTEVLPAIIIWIMFIICVVRFIEKMRDRKNLMQRYLFSKWLLIMIIVDTVAFTIANQYINSGLIVGAFIFGFAQYKICKRDLKSLKNSLMNAIINLQKNLLRFIKVYY